MTHTDGAPVSHLSSELPPPLPATQSGQEVALGMPEVAAPPPSPFSEERMGGSSEHTVPAGPGVETQIAHAPSQIENAVITSQSIETVTQPVTESSSKNVLTQSMATVVPPVSDEGIVTEPDDLLAASMRITSDSQLYRAHAQDIEDELGIEVKG